MKICLINQIKWALNQIVSENNDSDMIELVKKPTNRGTIGDPIRLVVNHYRINIEKLLVLNEYNVSVERIGDSKKSKDRDLKNKQLAKYLKMQMLKFP